MLSKSHLRTQLQVIAKTAARLGETLDGQDGDPEPLALAEAALALSKLQHRLTKLSDVLAGKAGKGKK